MRTHIETLADATPKARRRLRRLFDLQPGEGWPTPSDVSEAQTRAYNNERAEALRVARAKQKDGAP